jgi:hypothetical protein
MTHLSENANDSGVVRPVPQTTHLEIDMESALSPREIQSRVRAGDSVEEVAQAAGMTLDWIEPFAAPVIAEREYIAQQAQAHQVRRGGETIAHRTLGQVVSDRLASRRVDPQSLTWDAWRLEGRRWLVRVDYDSGKSHREARFVYDVNGRFSVADNDDALWLLGLHSASHGPQPGRRRREDEAEATVDLNDDLALIRAVQPRADELPDSNNTAPIEDGELDDAYSEVELAEVDGVYDIIPTATGGLDVLYDMLSSFDEDSVQIYAGLIREETAPSPAPVLDAAPDPVAKPRRTAESPRKPAAARKREVAPEPEPPIPEPATTDVPTPDQPSLVDESVPEVEPPEDAATKPRTRRKRAQVPSWDEIMFGSPKNRP